MSSDDARQLNNSVPSQNDIYILSDDLDWGSTVRLTALTIFISLTLGYSTTWADIYPYDLPSPERFDDDEFSGPGLLEDYVGVVDGGFILASEKLIPTLRFGMHEVVVCRLSVGMIFDTSDVKRDRFNHSLLGNYISLSLGASHPVTTKISVAFGSGLDAWYLWNVLDDEVKVGLPLWLEWRFTFIPKWSVFWNTKLTIESSDGLGIGLTREQVVAGDDATLPLLSTVGVGFQI